MMNFRAALLAPTVLLSIAGASLGAQAPGDRMVRSSSVHQGTLSFDGRATAGNFTGTTKDVTGEIKGGRLTEVRGWVEAPVRTLTTGNGRRDRDLNKSMESGKYPVIRFELTGVTAPERRNDSLNVMLQGRFSIHGVTRDAAVPASLVFRPEGIRVRGETPLNLKDYKIGGLSKALGMLKMHEEIVIHVDLMFGDPSPQSAVARP